jgi:hypothetical protein
MDTACYFRLGTMAMDASSVLECVIYENLGYFPWGKITFIDKMGLIQANYDFKEYTEIEITIGVYESESSKSEVVFKADIVSTAIRSSVTDRSSHEIDLMFILRGSSGNLLSNIPAIGYQNQSSVSVIKDICKKKNIKLNAANINAQDNMNWLLVNHNFLTAINYMCDRSYVEDSALIYNISIDGSVYLYSIKDKFTEKAKATLMISPHNYRNAPMNNGIEKIANTPVIYFHEKQYNNQSGLTKESSTIVLREVKMNSSKNKIESTSRTLTPGTTSRDGGSNVIAYQPSSSPQVYDKYSIAPAYRRAVIASYGFSLDITCENETFLNAGDVVDVVDGVFAHDTGVFTKTYLCSGKYLVLRKGYHFKREFGSGIGSFQTTIQLISNSKYTGKDAAAGG